jgi:cyclophilin family peptidyl-prolyl cis-trans isomerase
LRTFSGHQPQSSCAPTRNAGIYSVIRFLRSLVVASFAAIVTATAQNAPPVVTTQFGNATIYAGAPALVVNAATGFADPDSTAAVRMTTVLGNLDVVLFGQQTPKTVSNFLRYVDEGRYFITDPTSHEQAPSFIHRSVPKFIIQGGGYLATVNPQKPDSVLATAVGHLPPVPNEPGISNKRGTIAMAKLDGDPNSATSEWFINLADNGGAPSHLDTQNGGFTVFGRVPAASMAVADAIAAVPRYNFGSPFDSIPLRNYSTTQNVKLPNLILLPAIYRIPTLTFSASSSNTTVADVALSANGTNLLIHGKQNGSAQITVTATDVDGASVSQAFTVNVTTAPGRLVNISTRGDVGVDDDVLIGGFIIRGNAPKRVIVRAIGPSLASQNVSGPLANPVLELRDANDALVATNDDWGTNGNKQDIIDTTVAPTAGAESAILTTLASDPNNGARYTVIVKGVNRSIGVGLVEIYDLDSGPGSTILNISTRGRVNTGDDVLIGGFYVGGSEAKRILVRALGPSLKSSGVSGELNDPTLELVNGQGTSLATNDNWQTNSNKQEIIDSTVAPTDSQEPALLRTLSPGAYTAIVRGTGDVPTGVALVEVYQLP